MSGPLREAWRADGPPRDAALERALEEARDTLSQVDSMIAGRSALFAVGSLERALWGILSLFYEDEN